MVNYDASADLTCGDQHVNLDQHVVSLWVRRDGKWLALAHTGLPFRKAPPTM